jgi:hypothetical protein
MKFALALAAATVALASAPVAAAPAYDGAYAVAHEVLSRVLGREGNEAAYDGEQKAHEFGGLVDLEEESTEENFRCRFARVINAQTECFF